MPNQEAVPAWAQTLIDQNKDLSERIYEIGQEQQREREAKKKEPEKKEEPVDPEVLNAIMDNISDFPSSSQQQKTPALSSKLSGDAKKRMDEVMKNIF